MSECETCVGTGEVDCVECDGAGENESGYGCEACGGTGGVDCDACDGTGHE